MTYNEAIKELETILHSLENDQVDVDDLTARAERSAELIRLCRRKLRNAEASLDRVFDSLDEEDEVEEEDEPEMEDDENDEDEPEIAPAAPRPLGSSKARPLLAASKSARPTDTGEAGAAGAEQWA